MNTKKFKLWPWAAAWLILAVLSCYIRLWPLRAHLWDDSRDQATLMVVYKIKQTFLQQILNAAPNIPAGIAENLAEQKLNETLHDQNQKVMAAIDKVTAGLARQPGAPPEKIYLLESDPYDFYYLTQNIVKTGRIAAVIKGSKYFNPLMCAPFGYWQPFTLHPYWGFAIYKFMKLFNPHIPLMSAVAYTPLFTYLFILIAFLWVCRVLQFSVVSSFVGALFLVMAPINLKRGALGWYRTDPYNILFPLVLMGCLFLALRPASKKNGYLWAAAAGAVTSIYALFWQGWGFSFLLGVACALTAALYNFFIKKDPSPARQNLLFLGWFTGTCLLIVSMCFSFQDFFILFKEGFGELMKFTHRGLDLWPDQFMTVGELKKESLAEITRSAGGWVFMMLAFGGWVYRLRTGLKNFRQPQAIDTLILTVFLAATMALSTLGERFVLFATIPLSLLATGAVNRFISLRSVGLPLAGILIALTLVNANRDIQTILTPIFNSTWDKALTAIKTETPKDSIVDTWWAPGHFIKAIAHRAVPFDGASLDQSAVGYWMGNVFLSRNEAQARGILRMLNSSGNEAAEYLVKCGLKLADAVALLKTIAPQDRAQAEQTLEGTISGPQIKKLLSLIRGKKPHSYVLVYTELVKDNAMIAFNGRWNIKKMEEINARPDMLKNVPPRNSHAFIDFLWSTMGGMPKYSEALPLLGRKHDQLVFQHGLVIDLDTMNAGIQSSRYGQGQPLSVFYLKDGAVAEHVNPDGDLNYSVLLYQEDGQYAARLMDRALADSLIMKLYYFNGAGLKYFKPLIFTHDLTGRTRIKVFQVVY
ncbi:MAG: hypothetical protein KGJ09_04535 [Candidatus Omnitrophica bacterium]|nr:hypothetical protein [Candidatus Omnitrophota bacterium]MDE2009328.1 hypothetical protein [Candidatus Omnitrophota bacterium]MDE2214112.1 hypothetical protein [Candidatus Omnitrophota bacterium]MDE2231149.1 hypothetical protein [Candidatus Omnitrophota bacterium]